MTHDGRCKMRGGSKSNDAKSEEVKVGMVDLIVFRRARTMELQTFV